MSVLTALAVFQVCFPPPVQLQASDGAADALFGIAVDQDGPRIVVGAANRMAPPSFLPTGGAYVYDLVGTTWVEQAILEPFPAPSSSGHNFGVAVALDGDLVAVGAPGGGTGLAYVYRRSGAVWNQEAVLDPTAGVELKEWPQGFGIALDVEGDTLLVGMSYGHIGNGGEGRVYVYEHTPSGWQLQDFLLASDGAPGDNFGYAVALQGNTACIGATNGNGLKPDSGAVYVFTRSAGVWTQQAKVVASDGSTGDRFGFSLALDGDGLAVGAPWRPYVPPTLGEGGGVYYFTRSGSTWQERQLLRPADSNTLQFAGWTVALDGDYLVLGAPSQVFTSGYFHVYSRGSTEWVEHLKLAPPDAQGSDNVGRGLSLVGTRLVVGSPRSDASALDSGVAHVYQLSPGDPEPTFYCTAKIDSTGCLPHIYHVGLPIASAAFGGEPYTIRAWNMRPEMPAMLFYSTTGAASTPFAGGHLCLQPPVQRTQPITTGGDLAYPCSGQPLFDFNAWIATGSDPLLTAGREVWMQYWYRDPGGPPGQDVGLTSAIRVELCP